MYSISIGFFFRHTEMVHIDDDVLITILAHLPATCEGLVARSRALQAFPASRSIHILSCLSSAVINISNAVTFTEVAAEKRISVIDCDSKKVISIGCDISLLRFSFKDKPKKDTYLYLPDDRLVWTLKGARISASGFSSFPASHWVDKIKQFSNFSKEALSAASAPPVNGTLLPRRRPTQKVREKHESLFAAIFGKPLPHELTSLSVSDARIYDFPTCLDLASLVHLTIKNIPLPCGFVCALAAASANLRRLSLLDAGDWSSTASFGFALGNMVNTWSGQDGDAKELRVLDLDGTRLDSYQLAVLLRCMTRSAGGASFSCEMVEQIDNAYASERVFFSTTCDWSEPLFRLARDPTTFDIPFVRMRSTWSAPRPEQEDSVPEVDVTTPPPSRKRQYTNPKREMDRYMWQWKSVSCRCCGSVWPKHAVTVSARQTFVSECFKGKKACAQRPEFERASRGELWITKGNMIGQGGNDLTPLPSDVLRAEEKEQLVAIDPSTLMTVRFEKRKYL